MKRLLISLLVGTLSFAAVACGDSTPSGNTGETDTSENTEPTGPSFEEEQQKFIGSWKMEGFENSQITINSKFRFRMTFDTTKDNAPLLATLVFSTVEEPLLERTYRKVLIQYDEGQENARTGSPYTIKWSDDYNTFEIGGPRHTRIDSEDDLSF